MSLQLGSRPTPTHSVEEIFKYFFDLDNLTNDEFLIYRQRNYPSFIRLPTYAWEETEDAYLQKNWG